MLLFVQKSMALDGWMDGWVGESVDGRMDGWVVEPVQGLLTAINK